MTFTITRQHVLAVLAAVVVGAGAFVGVRAAGSGHTTHQQAADHTGTTARRPTAQRSAPTTTAPAPVGSGYLASGTSAAWFVQWQASGATISGTIQVDDLAGSAPNESLSANTYPVSGRINGSQISLSIDGQPDQFGTISGNDFTLDVPQSDGSLAPATFSSATAAQFNQAVGALNATAASADTAANQAAAVAAAAQRRQQQIQSDEQTIDQAAQTELGDAQSVETDIGSSGVAGDLLNMKQSLAGEASDLQITRQDAQVVTQDLVPGAGNSGSACGDAGTVQGDAGTVQGDQGTVQGDLSTLSSDTSTLSSDLATLRQDAAALASDQAVLPSYQPSTTPLTGSQLQSVEGQATSTLQQASTAAAQAKARAGQLVAEANTVATQAEQTATKGTPGGC